MSADIEKRLQRMEDIEDIKQLIARYAKAVDLNGDPALLTACFTEDASWNCEGVGGWQGRDALVAGLRETCTVTLPWALHYMTQPIITVAEDGQTASGEYYLWELAKATPEGGGATEDTWIGGWYESDFRKENGGWRFSKTELFLKLLSATSKADWETPIGPWQG
jgi:hypothetical protein